MRDLIARTLRRALAVFLPQPDSRRVRTAPRPAPIVVRLARPALPERDNPYAYAGEPEGSIPPPDLIPAYFRSFDERQEERRRVLRRMALAFAAEGLDFAEVTSTLGPHTAECCDCERRTEAAVFVRCERDTGRALYACPICALHLTPGPTPWEARPRSYAVLRA